MTTPLPEPTFLRPVYRVFTEEQILNYGAAEYKRAIEFAVSRCMYRSHRNDDMGAIIASDILNLGSAS